MKILRVYNDGLLDLNELRLMGCSSKLGSNTIGKYGTGLKYAISVLTRENIDFNIYIGGDKVQLQTEEVTIRDNTFHKVIIDYESTSITTNLGVDWTVGQGLREFIANALDEGGGYEIIDSEDLYKGGGETVITFDLSQVEEYLEDFDFDDWIEVESGFFFKQLDTPRRAKVFKQGFLVYEAESDSSYDYRIDGLKINESRMAEDRFQVKRGIANIQSLMDKEDVEIILENKETELATFYDNDELGSGWNEIKKKDIGKNDGYELQKLVHANIKKQTNEDEVSLLYNDWTYVTHEDEIEDGIYMQEEESDGGWDIDLSTFKIYIFKQYPDSHYIDTMSNNDVDYTEVIEEAKRYREAAKYVKKHKLKTAIDTTLHFLNTKPTLIEIDNKTDITYLNF